MRSVNFQIAYLTAITIFNYLAGEWPQSGQRGGNEPLSSEVSYTASRIILKFLIQKGLSQYLIVSNEPLVGEGMDTEIGLSINWTSV
jgi:hypothetical protein